MACVCSHYNVCSDWLILGHLIFSRNVLGPISDPQKTKAKRHIIKHLLPRKFDVYGKIYTEKYRAIARSIRQSLIAEEV